MRGCCSRGWSGGEESIDWDVGAIDVVVVVVVITSATAADGGVGVVAAVVAVVMKVMVKASIRGS